MSTATEPATGCARGAFRPRATRDQRHRRASGIPATRGAARAPPAASRARSRQLDPSQLRGRRADTRGRRRELGVEIEEGHASVALSGRRGIEVRADDLLDRAIARLSANARDAESAQRSPRARCATTCSSSRSTRSSRSISTKPCASPATPASICSTRMHAPPASFARSTPARRTQPDTLAPGRARAPARDRGVPASAHARLRWHSHRRSSRPTHSASRRRSATSTSTRPPWCARRIRPSVDSGGRWSQRRGRRSPMRCTTGYGRARPGLTKGGDEAAGMIRSLQAPFV